MIDGTLSETAEHPVVRFFSRDEVGELAAPGLLRGTHIELAVDHHQAGRILPVDLLHVVPPSPLPPG